MRVLKLAVLGALLIISLLGFCPGFATKLSIFRYQEPKQYMALSSLLKDAIRRVDEDAVLRGLNEYKQRESYPATLASNRSTDESKFFDFPIAYYLSEMEEDSSFSAHRILDLLESFRFGSSVNDHILPRYHPLTCAYRQQRYQVAARLLKFGNSLSKEGNQTLLTFEKSAQAPLIPEVYASYLSCSDISHVDSSVVTLITFIGERRDCVFQYPKSVPFANSRLLQYLETRKFEGAAEAFPHIPEHLPFVWRSKRRIVHRDRKNRKNDFSLPEIGVLPAPAEETLLHPILFDDFLTRISYSVIGGSISTMPGSWTVWWLLFSVQFICLLVIFFSIWNEIVKPVCRLFFRF